MTRTNTAEVFKYWDFPTKLTIIPYNIGTDYFHFINKQKKHRLNPLTVTSRLMILILRYFIITKNFKINKIILTDDDPVLGKKIHYLIKKSNDGHSYLFFKFLLNELRELDSEDYDYIEILKIEVRSKNQIISFQNNGLVSASNNCFVKNSSRTSRILSQLLKQSGSSNV